MSFGRREVLHSAIAQSKLAQPGQFVTIVRLFDGFQAHLVKSVLEDHDIPTVIQGEYTGSVFPRVSLLGARISGGIQLQVPAERVEEALALLAEVEAREEEDFDYHPTAEEYLEAEGDEVQEAWEEETVWCPQCGAGTTQRVWFTYEELFIASGVMAAMFWFPIWALFAGGLLGLIKASLPSQYRCEACGHKWRLQKEEE